MEGPKWDELNADCLFNVFGTVGMESLLLDIPFVCKSWYKVTLNPLCWQQLIFPEYRFGSRVTDDHGLDDDDSIIAFIMFVIGRSRGSATSLVLPSWCTEGALVYVSQQCPALKFLVLRNDYSISPYLISKWKNLVCLELRSCCKMEEIITQVRIHCKNFATLSVSRACTGNVEALTIATALPNLKTLHLRNSSIELFNLLTILNGCKELVYLDVRDCIGFHVEDEILKLVSPYCYIQVR